MVDQVLGGLFGGQDQDDEPTRRRRARDFIDRHERGAHDRMSNAEVMQNYQATTSGLSPDEYQQAATDAFRQMSPEQRRELRREMRQRSRDRYGAADDSPEEMGRAMRQATEEQKGSGGLAGLFGIGDSGSGGAAATGDKSPMQHLEGMLDNPVVKVGIAGIAAMAAKKLTEPRS